MCGITGYFGSSLDEKLLSNATNSLEKRGPDAKGTFVSENKQVGLGHRRLSIIDTSSGANQPITTEDGKFTIVFNGEIYNFKELKRSLISKGYSFKTDSDTEVVLNLFHLYGNKCWELLNGFFAIAIYDNFENKLHIARDRIGIKPLYYSFHEGILVFGSELKALMALGVKKEINQESLNLYFRLNYIPAPYSILKHVHKLTPGTFLTYNGKELNNEKFFELKPTDSGQSNLSYEQSKNKLVSLLEDSVSRRMISDVPLGTFLSGGIDSSVITALASKQTQNLDTFSVGFKDNKFFDETKYARLVAKQYKTNHHEIYLSNDDLMESLFGLLNYTDEPFADSSALAVNALCKETRKHVTVALSGDGADELFAGYNKYQGEFRVQNPKFLESMVGIAHPIWKTLPKSRNGSITNTFRKLHKFSSGVKKSKQERYFDWCSIGDKTLINSLLLNAYEIDINSITQFITSKKGMNDVLLNDIHLVLPDDMLVKVDRMSMANSLEVRVPFLDHELVEFANSLPEEYKINRNQKKRILQDAFRSILPEELYNRPKHGFEVPLLDWLKYDLSDKIQNEYLEKDFLEEQGIFNPDVCDNLIKKLHSNNPEDSHATIWALVVFQHWYKKYLS